jgi:hypothetical protein
MVRGGGNGRCGNGNKSDGPATGIRSFGGGCAGVASTPTAPCADRRCSHSYGFRCLRRMTWSQVSRHVVLVAPSHQAWGAKVDFGKSLLALLVHPWSGGYQGKVGWSGRASSRSSHCSRSWCGQAPSAYHLLLHRHVRVDVREQQSWIQTSVPHMGLSCADCGGGSYSPTRVATDRDCFCGPPSDCVPGIRVTWQLHNQTVNDAIGGGGSLEDRILLIHTIPKSYVRLLKEDPIPGALPTGAPEPGVGVYVGEPTSPFSDCPGCTRGRPMIG